MWPHLQINPTLARFAILLIPFFLTALLGFVRPISSRRAWGALLAFLWNLPFLFLLNALAVEQGWWQFHGDKMLFLRVPVDLVLGWACFWSGFMVLAFYRFRIEILILGALIFDLLIMPQLNPLIRLGAYWWIGEILTLTICLAPGLFLARWTEKNTHLGLRVTFLAVGFTACAFFLIPAAVLAQSGGDFFSIFHLGFFQTAIAFNMLLVPSVIGLSAVYELALRGHGTPLPFDPPQKLVCTGPYAYISNPMQLSGLWIYLVLACIYSNFTLLTIPIVFYFFSIGFAWWQQQEDLGKRFGKSWSLYKKNVPMWIPRWTPYITRPSTIYFDEDCPICVQARQWFEKRTPIQLAFCEAAQHPTQKLTRITYRDPDGFQEQGIRAIGRALEHIDLFYACLGWSMRLPLMAFCLQILMDGTVDRWMAAQPPPTDENKQEKVPQSHPPSSQNS